MERDEYNIRRLHDLEEFQESKAAAIFLGSIFLLLGGYSLYNDIKNGESLSIIALSFTIVGLLMVIFFGRSLFKSKEKIREVKTAIPIKRLNVQRRIDIYATLVMIFGTIALIFLVLLLIVVGIPQEAGGKLSEIISQSQNTIIILSTLFFLFVILTYFSFGKLKKIKKEFRESKNISH